MSLAEVVFKGCTLSQSVHLNASVTHSFAQIILLHPQTLNAYTLLLTSADFCSHVHHAAAGLLSLPAAPGTQTVPVQLLLADMRPTRRPAASKL